MYEHHYSSINFILFILFILYLQLTNLQLKTDIIMYTSKNSYVLLIKKHANSCQLPDKIFFKLKF